MALDHYFFAFLNALSGQNQLMDTFFVFLARYLIFLMILSAACFWYVWGATFREKARALFIFLLFWLASHFVVVNILHLFVERSRPFEIWESAIQLVPANDLSFPSQHATAAFFIASFVFLINRKVGGWFLLAAFLVALGRVLAGVHYPTDVVAGALLGILAAILANWVFKRRVKKSQHVFKKKAR